MLRLNREMWCSFPCGHPPKLMRLSMGHPLPIAVVQSLSRVQLFATPWTAGCKAFLCFSVSQSLLKLMSTESVKPSNLPILGCPFSSCPQSFPAQGLCQWVGSLPQVTKVLELQHQSFQWIFRVDFNFRIDWLDLLAVQGTLKSLLQLHNSKASIFCHSACFMVQLSHPYMTTGKIIALTIQIFVGKLMSLLFNTKCRFVIAFLPRSKHLLISWLQSPPTVILEPKKRKSVTASTFSPSICLEVMGLDAMILVFWMLSSKPAFSLLFHPQESL